MVVFNVTGAFAAIKVTATRLPEVACLPGRRSWLWRRCCIRWHARFVSEAADSGGCCTHCGCCPALDGVFQRCIAHTSGSI